jgi:hypothetical protein
MALKGATYSKDIVVPKGVAVVYPIIDGVVDADGGIDLGYCQEGSLKITEEMKEKYTARDKSRAKIIDKVVKTDYTMPMKLVSVNPDNLALIFRATKGNLEQNAGSYSDTALNIIAPAALDRAQKLGKRAVSIKKIDYDGGTSTFTVGAKLSTGASTARIIWKTGTIVAGSLYVAELTGTDFINDAVLADDNNPPGAAVQNGAVETIEDIVLTKTDGSVRYVLDTDYGLDPRSGTVFYLEAGAITAAQALKGYFDYAELSETVIQSGITGAEYYQVEILPDKDENENCIEFVAWKCAIKFDGELKLVTEGTDEISLDVTFTPLVGGPGATAEDPVYRMIIDES